jgi:hypothetical protein
LTQLTDDLKNTSYGEWARKGATLSDTTARREYGLTQKEILDALRKGQLQFREDSAHGNPFWRLLRHEVEAMVEAKHGAQYLKSQQVQSEVAKINKELKKLKAQIIVLEERKAKLVEGVKKSGVILGKQVRNQ